MTILKQGNASVYVQFMPGKDTYYLGTCVDLDAIPNPRVGGIDLIQCRDRSGKGYVTVGKKYSPPGTIEVTLTELLDSVASWLEKVKCPFTLYALDRTCGDAGVFKNWVRGAAVDGMEVVNDTLNQIAHHVDDNESMHEYSLVGVPPRVDFHQVVVSRETTAETLALNTLALAGNLFCDDDCGHFTLPCDRIIAGADPAAGTANVQISADAGNTWAPAAVDPFAAALTILGSAYFEISAGVNRMLVVRGTLAATPLAAAYSDDGGATWTLVTIGSTVTEAATGPKSLFALDQDHVWIGTDKGNVYFSSDGGQSFTVQGSAIVADAAAQINAIHFADANVGFAVCAGDVIIYTLDGGDHWAATTDNTGTGDDLYAVYVFNRNRVIVGTDGAMAGMSSLWMTFDGGASWESRSFIGSGGESVKDISFVNDLAGYLISELAGPVGSIHRTIDGGFSWQELIVPTNAGLNAIMACGPNEAFAVGEPQGGTAVILHIG